MCAECHSTNVRKNYDAAKDSFKTTFSEVSSAAKPVTARAVAMFNGRRTAAHLMSLIAVFHLRPRHAARCLGFRTRERATLPRRPLQSPGG